MLSQKYQLILKVSKLPVKAFFWNCIRKPVIFKMEPRIKDMSVFVSLTLPSGINVNDNTSVLTLKDNFTWI